LVARQKNCTFPNALFFPKSLLDKGYVLGGKFNIIDVKKLRFNPLKKINVILLWQDVTSDTIDTQQYIQNSYSNTNKMLAFQANRSFPVNMIQLFKINLMRKCFFIKVWDYFLFEYIKICFQPPWF
jgi:hypothetical protein